MHRNLRSFMALLERERELVAIEAEVEPYLELAEIHWRVIARGGPALLFKRVRGSRYAFFTLPLVYTEHPTTRKHNLGIYRMPRYDSETTGMHWQIHKGGGLHYHAAEALNQSLPVTVFLGGPPALILAAVAPLPEDVPELVLASLLEGEKLGVVQPTNSAHRLVAESEFALTGVVPPVERRPEG